MPLSAASNLPTRDWAAPVKAPFSFLNSSDSIRSFVVDHLGDVFLSLTAFSLDQDGCGVTLRDPLHHFEDPLEGGGLGHDLVDVATVPLDTLEHRHFFSLTVSNVSAIRS